jgi:hypothetical protein
VKGTKTNPNAIVREIIESIRRHVRSSYAPRGEVLEPLVPALRGWALSRLGRGSAVRRLLPIRAAATLALAAVVARLAAAFTFAGVLALQACFSFPFLSLWL